MADKYYVFCFHRQKIELFDYGVLIVSFLIFR